MDKKLCVDCLNCQLNDISKKNKTFMEKVYVSIAETHSRQNALFHPLLKKNHHHIMVDSFTHYIALRVVSICNAYYA